MKKISRRNFLLASGAVTIGAALAACGGSSASTATSTTTEATSEAAASTSGSKTDVAFVTDVGNIDDQSFNQYTWQGVQDFCSANSLNANYYRPTEDSDAARLEQMDNAVNDGAKSIVVAGYLFGNAIAEAQEKYPDVQFLALDVSASDLGDKAPTANTALITYKEEQAGYLAGYAAVYDGYKELGFLGGMAVPAVIRYGYGFVQGADAAAKELGVKVDMNYSWQYGASFSASPELQTMVSGWYEAGTEVVFACGGSMFASVAAAAGAADGKVVGVDVDQSPESDTVITSAMKGLADSVQWALGKFYSNEFASIGGVGTSLGANENAVGLPTATWSLTKWTVDEYNTMLKDIVGGKITIDSDYNNLKSTDNVTLNII